ncbi:SnoaL-like domain-containing protein [Haloechinothrix alba]|uniref:SnoaL-like domain-containing protein n=1 Tax=Haloechinothrix alba TaxID=664784 RepID=A0A238WDN6_9PSEU|nr:nuclear transport factor 2 family protein [Haloechinothrix alba]SNR44706.1 SnoaL-like domain-containing protein [Haloechinothrix alba]
MTERFIAAALGGDLASLLELLAPDVTMWNDSGGKVAKASMHPVHGRDKVSRMITGFARTSAGVGVHYRQVNHDPAAVVFDGDDLFAVMVLDLTPDGEQISGVYTVANPDKLTHLD